ncbi:hypothetical protein TNIN_460851 [Trichonephila inaurata madagascariensis]|uniref:Uncharacterized protein n=1 Tax=Trichonephila inaurata madagascariensis TaxID=2747483 RepID=A0A8X6WQX1_9ARAC|nr:hypothetical protein TNIN_460851 [Trichonephila inaurata madagascariensis]
MLEDPLTKTADDVSEEERDVLCLSFIEAVANETIEMASNESLYEKTEVGVFFSFQKQLDQSISVSVFEALYYVRYLT